MKTKFKEFITEKLNEGKDFSYNEGGNFYYIPVYTNEKTQNAKLKYYTKIPNGETVFLKDFIKEYKDVVYFYIAIIDKKQIKFKDGESYYVNNYKERPNIKEEIVLSGEYNIPIVAVAVKPNFITDIEIIEKMKVNDFVEYKNMGSIVYFYTVDENGKQITAETYKILPNGKLEFYE